MSNTRAAGIGYLLLDLVFPLLIIGLILPSYMPFITKALSYGVYAATMTAKAAVKVVERLANVFRGEP